MKFTYPPESKPLPGYTIKRAIHRGGFGEVYYALSDSGREVALKLLQHNTDVELRGVQQCLNLSHPNLVTLFDIKQDGEGDWWILMEYVAGDTLDTVLRRSPQGLVLEEVKSWVEGLCAGVGYLHDRGIVHRDLKPANLFRDSQVVKIGDVGLSKYIGVSRRSAQTQSVGTVHYMAPEVSRGQYGKEVDIYALGIITYEMMTGALPFDGDSTGEILMKHLTAAPELGRVEERFRPVLQKALDKDPLRRYASAKEFGAAFFEAVAGDVSLRPRVAATVIRDEDSARKNTSIDSLAEVSRLLLPKVSIKERISRRLSPTARSNVRKLQWWCVSAPQTVFSTGLLTVMLWLVTPRFFATMDHPGSADPSAIGLFACSIILSAWVITAICRVTPESFRRSRLFFAGAIVGVITNALQKFLLVTFLSSSPLDSLSGLISTLGTFALMKDTDPTWAGHAAFYAMLFAICPWTELTNRRRRKRIRPFTLVKGAFLSLCITALFAYVPSWGMFVTVFLTAVVQLASDWRPDVSK